MKLNYLYEVALKKAVANMFEVRELKRLAEEDISHFHYNLDARTPCIELLNKIRFKQEGEILVFEGAASLAKGTKGQFMARQHNSVRYRMRPIQSIKIREERFATPMDKKLMAKARLKQAVIKILIKLQAYHIYEKIKRNKYCIIPVAKFVKSYQKSASREGGRTNPEKSPWGGAAIVNEEGADQMNNGGVNTSGESDHLFDEEVDSDMVMDENGILIDHVDYNDEDDEGDEFVEQDDEDH